MQNIEYMKRTREEDIPLINIGHREALKLYLTGVTSTDDHIDQVARPVTLLKKSHLKSGKLTSATEVQQQMLKRREVKAEEKRERRERKSTDFIAEFEVKIAGKTNCL
jgi:hypothetical protein